MASLTRDLTAAAGALAPPAGRARRAGVAVLTLAAVGSALAVHPHHLSYFNALIGGPANGYRYLVDASIDWGQDLKRLAAWLERERPARVRLSARPLRGSRPAGFPPARARRAQPGIFQSYRRRILRRRGCLFRFPLRR